MPFVEPALATGFLAIAIALAAIMSATAKDATDRIASFLPTATVAAYQLILSSYPLDGCNVGQVCTFVYCTMHASPLNEDLSSSHKPLDACRGVLLWITLSVLTLVTAGMALVQHRNETSPEETSVLAHVSKGGSAAFYSWLRAIFSAVAFFFVSFLTPPAPQCLIPQTPIPSGTAFIVAVLLGTIMTVSALYFPPATHSRPSANANGDGAGISGNNGDVEVSITSLAHARHAAQCAVCSGHSLQHYLTQIHIFLNDCAPVL